MESITPAKQPPIGIAFVAFILSSCNSDRHRPALLG